MSQPFSDKRAVAQRYGERWARALRARGTFAPSPTFNGAREWQTALSLVPTTYAWEEVLELADIILDAAAKEYDRLLQPEG